LEEKFEYNPFSGVLEDDLAQITVPTFDVRYNSFWLKEWGVQPKTIAEQKRIASMMLEKFPVLIPIYSHRYIPSMPNEHGNPALSVHQTDIMHYGFDLADYFSNEFKCKLPPSFGKILAPKKIEYWDTIIG
jgi:hypothetical protein